MKTPEEIKKGLEYLSIKDIVKKLDMWKEGIAYDYAEDAASDAIAYIQRLEADLKQEKADHQHTYECAEVFQKENAELKRERGAAVMALATCAMDGLDGNICNYCTHKNCDEQDLLFECFEWRGPCEENTENP